MMLGNLPISGGTLSDTGNLSFTQTIVGVGADVGSFGAPYVFNHEQRVYPVGLDAFGGFGFPAGGFVDFAVRRRYPFGFDASAFGTATLSGGVRWVYPTHFDATSFGNAFVADRQREVIPAWFVATSWGNAQVGYHRTVSPTGFDASLFGPATEVFDNRKYAYPSGYVATLFGTAFIAPRVRNVYPDSFWSRTPGQVPETRWGRPEVYNLRQYIQQFYEVTPDDGGVFGRWHEIENRNRSIGALGWNSQKFALTNQVELTGVALGVHGFDASAFGNQLVAYRIRTVNPVGEDTSQFTQWANIRNTAQLLPLSGFDASRFGNAAVVNTRRYFDYIGAGSQGTFGSAFVAYRVRTLQPYYPYEGGEVREPVVQHGTRYIRPVGILPKEVGAATIEERFNIIAPRWVHVERSGTPSLRNVTPQLYALGYPQTEWGNTAIHNQFEHYSIQGFAATLWGLNVIEYREKRPAPAGINAIRWGPNTQINKVIPDPPSPQTAEALGWDASHVPGLAGDGDTGVLVRTNVIRPISDAPQTLFGTAKIVNMAIGPCGGIVLTDNFGRASVSGTQYIDLVGKGNDVSTYGKPRLSPHTIWASTLTPGQAIANHDNIEYRVIDYDPGAGSANPRFGLNTFIDHRNRRLTHYHLSAPVDQTVGEGFGAPTIQNRRRYLLAQGGRVGRFGIPVLNGGGQIDTTGDEMSAFGAATVDHYIDPLIPRRLFPSLVASTEFGVTDVSNFHREVKPGAIDATVFGDARLHPPEPVIPQGFRADVYGDTFISNYIRYVEPIGIEATQIDYVGGSFSDRMRVSERHTLQVQTIGATLRFGSPVVSNRVRTIKPLDEIVGVVAVPSVTGRSYVSVAAYGIDACTFGDVDRWEANKIKAHGDDMLQPGYPRMARGINPASILGVMGDPRVGQPIRPAGMFTQVFGDTTITHGDNLDFVCGQLPRGIAVPGNYFGAFGPNVSVYDPGVGSGVPEEL